MLMFSHDLFFLLLGQVLPQRIDQRIGSSGLEQHGDDGEFPIAALCTRCASMSKRLAVDLLLARLVKVKLHQLVTPRHRQ